MCVIQTSVQGTAAEGMVYVSMNQLELRENEVTVHDIVVPPR
jgi:hypothetical protein